VLDGGNQQLNDAMKQLDSIRVHKEKSQAKLLKAENTLAETGKKHSSSDDNQAGPSAKGLKRH